MRHLPTRDRRARTLRLTTLEDRTVPTASLSVADVTVTEGDTGPYNLITFTVTLSEPSEQTVSVWAAGTDGTAIAESDYYATGGYLEFAPGETTKTIDTYALADTTIEFDETFSLTLSNPTNADLADDTANATIVNDDFPTVLISDIPVAWEGRTGTSDFNFTVSLSEPAPWPVTVDFATSGGSATPGTDYTAISGTLTFDPGETSKTIAVSVNGDRDVEPNEWFGFNLTNPSGAVLGWASDSGGIDNDDITNFIQFPAVRGTYAEYFDSSAPTVTPWGSYIDVFAANEPPPVVATAPPREFRGLFEFGLLPEVMGGDFGAATLTFNQTYFYPGSQPIQVYGYPADLSLSAADGTAPGVLLATFDATTGNGPRGVILDRDALAGLLANTNLLGIRFVTTPDSQVRIETSSSSTIGVNFYRDPLGVIPTVGVADTQATEGDVPLAGQPQWLPMAFRVSLSAPFGATIDVAYTITAGTATSGTDYTATNGVVRIYAGQTQANVFLSIKGDNLVEGNETVNFQITGASFTAIDDAAAVGTIVDNDFVPQVTTLTASSGATETQTAVQFYGQATYNPVGGIVMAAWDFGDGTVVEGNVDYMLPYASHVYADSGTYTARLIIIDPNRGQSNMAIPVVVGNLNPTVTTSFPTPVVANFARSFTFTPNDPSALDVAAGLNFFVDWRDGTTSSITATGGPVTLNHTFPGFGTYPVLVTVRDKDGGVVNLTRTVSVSQAAVIGSDLLVGGTPGADRLSFYPTSNTAAVSVLRNGSSIGTFTVPTGGSIAANGGDGDDTLELMTAIIGGVTRKVTQVVAFDGGAGRDVLNAMNAGASVVLNGGAGDDTLTGGNYADVLVGGLGADSLSGGMDNDILVGNATTYDSNLDALRAIRAEWARTDVPFMQKVDRIRGAVGGGLNGSYVLNPTTVFEDQAFDDLLGGSGQDWFFGTISGTWMDRWRDFGFGGDISTM